VFTSEHCINIYILFLQKKFRIIYKYLLLNIYVCIYLFLIFRTIYKYLLLNIYIYIIF